MVTAVQTITIKNIENKESVLVEVQPMMVLGRSEPGNPVDIDLTHIGGYRLGVSRKHVRISASDGQLFIQDLGSRNGTMLNGKKLNPEDRYPLHTGDHIQLSRMSVEVQIKTN